VRMTYNEFSLLVKVDNILFG